MTNSFRNSALVLALICASAPASAQEDKDKQCPGEAMVCVKMMTEQFANKGWIGIVMDYDDRTAPRILKVIAGSPAEEAGLRPGDVMLSFAGAAYATASEEELRQAKQALLPGSDIVIGVRRGEEELDITVHAAEIPEGVLAQWIGTHLLTAHKDQIAAVDPH